MQVKDKKGQYLASGSIVPKSAEYYKTFAQKMIDNNDVILFTKSYCPYSKAIKKLFNENMMRGEYSSFDIDVEEDGNEVHKAVIEITGRTSVPNVFVGGTNTGGDVETEALANSGELKSMLHRSLALGRH